MDCSIGGSVGRRRYEAVAQRGITRSIGIIGDSSGGIGDSSSGGATATSAAEAAEAEASEAPSAAA